MPFEKEFKYLVGTDVIDELHEKIKLAITVHPGIVKKEISQFYFTNATATRVRKLVVGDATKYYHTTKYNIRDTTLEIEPEITKEEYDLLSSTQKGFLVEKTRYVLPIDGLNWEVDFFHRKGISGIYLCMIEVEVANDVTTRPILPSFLKSFNVYNIKHSDSHYQNANMNCTQTVRMDAVKKTNKYRQANG